MTSDVKGWEQLFYVRIIVFFLVSLGRAGASQTRRLLTLLSVGWLPPSLPPSGACLMRGTSVPVGLITPPRVTPHRGCVSSKSGGKPGQLVRQAAASFRLSVTRPPAWPWPTCKPFMLGPWRRRPAGPFCLWPCAGDTVCRGGPGPASCWPGARSGALPGAGAGADGLGRATGTPRHLRPAHDAHGYARFGSGGPADAAPPWHMPRVCAPENA